ncbi:MAG: preprotein translocase subunit SecE [Herpetosiphonaceae bacterium]|nr:preprotein translocase subunit SecE [Herpetosiphonaceae bacterium]
MEVVVAVATDEQKPNPIGQFLREASSEMKKVVWPSREETQRLTLVVIGISLSIGLLLGGFDYLFTGLINLIRGI